MTSVPQTVLNDREVNSQIIQLMWEASDEILEIYQSEDIDLQQKTDASP